MTNSAMQIVAAPTPVLLQRIGALRVQAWTTEHPQAATMTEWLDGIDPRAWHWVIFDGDQMVAAARLSIHTSLCDLPDCKVYSDLLVAPPPAPMASLNRLVVHPSARGEGLSNRIDESRLCFARERGCRSIVCSVPRPERARRLRERGFAVIGMGRPYPDPPGCYGPPPLIMVLTLPARPPSQLSSATTAQPDHDGTFHSTARMSGSLNGAAFNGSSGRSRE